MEFIRPYDLEAQKKLSIASRQKYDRTKIEITKGGKTYNLYDSIQANREDTEIYPTLEKYGNLQVMERTDFGIYTDLSEAMSYQELLIQDKKLEEIFDNLPSKERNIFNNDFYQFKQNGLAYYQEKAKAEIENAQKNRKIAEEESKKPINVKVINEDKK